MSVCQAERKRIVVAIQMAVLIQDCVKEASVRDTRERNRNKFAFHSLKMTSRYAEITIRERFYTSNATEVFHRCLQINVLEKRRYSFIFQNPGCFIENANESRPLTPKLIHFCICDGFISRVAL